MDKIKEESEQCQIRNAELKQIQKERNREMMNIKLEIDREKLTNMGGTVSKNQYEIDLIDQQINFSKTSLVRSKSTSNAKLPKLTDFKSNNTVLRSKNDIYALMHSTSVPLSKDFLLSLNDEEFQVLWSFIEQEKELHEEYDKVHREKAELLENQARKIETSKLNYEI